MKVTVVALNAAEARKAREGLTKLGRQDTRCPFADVEHDLTSTSTGLRVKWSLRNSLGL